jgi:trehalose 6-phosphate phosphatase
MVCELMARPDKEPSDRADRIVEQLRARPEQSALVLDVDGTLAPIVQRPGDAAVPADTRALLSDLNRRYAIVACLSGRRALDAQRVVGLPELVYVGNHGLESLRPNSTEPETEPEASGHMASVRSFVQEAYSPEMESAGIRLEDKEAIWSLHWRGAEDESAAHELLQATAHAAVARGLVPHWGRKVLEVRPPVPIDKGTAVARIVRRANVTGTLYGGDDTTDLDAFRELRQLRAGGALSHAVCVGVRSAEGPAAIADEADIVVDGPPGMQELLARL